ncbi:MAG: DUF885 family protein, partial [Candidatus Eisenbacteria bacterium]|nr:DUF885 family protein [Candidatus Eisenbacteria bacterium]
MPVSLAELTDQCIDFISAEYPVSATALGLHSRDGSLGSFSREAHEARRDRTEGILSDLEKLSTSDMSADDLIDRQVLMLNLRSSIFSHDVLRSHERNPADYVGAGLYGCNQLLLRDFAPLEERARCFASRLRDVPQVLADARANVTEPPRAFASVAASLAKGGVSFLETTVPSLSAELPGLAGELESAAGPAKAAFAETAEHFERAAAASDEPFHIGRDAYEWLLTERHLLDLTSGDLLAIGERAISETTAQMERAAREIDARR